MAIVHSDVGLPEGKQKKKGNDWPCPQPENRPCFQFAGSNWQLGGWVSAIEATWLGYVWYVPKFMAHFLAGVDVLRIWFIFYGKAGLLFGSPGHSSTPGIVPYCLAQGCPPVQWRMIAPQKSWWVEITSLKRLTCPRVMECMMFGKLIGTHWLHHIIYTLYLYKIV